MACHSCTRWFFGNCYYQNLLNLSPPAPMAKILKFYSIIMTCRRQKLLEVVTNILSILARRRRKIWDFAIQKQGGMNPPSFEIFQNWGGFFQNWGGIPPHSPPLAQHWILYIIWHHSTKCTSQEEKRKDAPTPPSEAHRPRTPTTWVLSNSINLHNTFYGATATQLLQDRSTPNTDTDTKTNPAAINCIV